MGSRHLAHTVYIKLVYSHNPLLLQEGQLKTRLIILRIIQSSHLTIQFSFLRWSGVLFMDSVRDFSNSSLSYGEDALPGVHRLSTG